MLRTYSTEVLTWAVLVAMSVGLLLVSPTFTDRTAITTFVTTVAFAKAALVAWVFMEVRGSDPRLRLFFVCWMAATWLLIVGLEIAVV